MARYHEGSCRQCRREGDKLFLKGARCLTPKCALERRNYPPGFHTRRVRPSDYGVQLREKQKIKRIYGVLEVPFKNYYIAATKSGEVTGHKLLELLEMRLDNVVYRLGWASSRSQARQIVSHGHIRVGDKKVNVPSYQTKAGQKISLTARGQKSQIISINIKEKHTVPAWIATKPQAAEADIIRPPKREEIDAQVNEQLVIEYYSR